jgi:hypothetical protein
VVGAATVVLEVPVQPQPFDCVPAAGEVWTFTVVGADTLIVPPDEESAKALAAKRISPRTVPATIPRTRAMDLADRWIHDCMMELLAWCVASAPRRREPLNWSSFWVNARSGHAQACSPTTI